MQSGKLWDIFCRVVDNYGDVGVCWRLCADLVARGQRVRLWIDDASPLRWMAPNGVPGVEVRAWTQPLATVGLAAGDVLVEAFGCEIAPEFIAIHAESTRAKSGKPFWINLEYLSAESYVERCHGLPSPVMQGPGAGLTKQFFFPGFTTATGGLLREPGLVDRQAGFDRSRWLATHGLTVTEERLVALFCYEPPALTHLLELLAQGPGRSRLLVTAGRATAAVQQVISEKNRLQPTWNGEGLLSISYLPFLTQHDFDHLLWTCDLNIVRGEDSLVRALWAAKPFIWQIYPQQDDAHHAKLEAFLGFAEVPQALRDWHLAWNGLRGTESLPTPDLPSWQESVQALRRYLWGQDDLVTRLVRFASENH